MTTIRPMTVQDLTRFNNVNLDQWTETYNMNFYLHYLVKWPECCVTAENADGTIAGYMIGKVEGQGEQWHGHVTALSVAPEFRRTGLAKKLMEYLEVVSEQTHDCYFVDLFVRVTNTAAITFYQSLGYVVYRIVTGYYSGEEDAYDMRKALSRDRDQKSIADPGKRVDPSEYR
mmetsp:Transcript_29382/g.66408  ORF Transcript_29382/g.66408 Transcript_29382/m.66408 type:complete len:173 (+) Transcript_29382:39-557(+)